MRSRTSAYANGDTPPPEQNWNRFLFPYNRHAPWAPGDRIHSEFRNSSQKPAAKSFLPLTI
jgi:hypothetical protein